MDFTEENSLKALLQGAKENRQLVSSVESIQLINRYDISNIVENCSENTVHLRDLFVKHLKLEEIKDKNGPTFTFASQDRTSYLIAVKQKAISLVEIDLLHRVFPNLKSVSLHMFNLRYETVDDLQVDKAASNSISSIDMTFNTFPVDMSKLIMYIFDGYGENLKTLKIKKGGHIMNKDKKWDSPSEEVVDSGKKLLERKYHLPNLETVEICYFYHQFPIAQFTECLSKSNCALKHASFIGIAKLEPVALHLKNMESLASLALGTYKYPNLQDLEGLSLESLSLCWGDYTPIDIVSALDTFPALKKLDLGHDADYVRLKEGKVKVKLNQKAVLESLTLHHAVLDKDALEKFARYFPNLSCLKLSHCRFGVSRESTEETLSLEKYHLKQLILENCSLHANRKDSIEKRTINKLIIAIDSPNKYTAQITSKNQARMAKFESISHVDNEFSYYSFIENEPRPTNTLKIFLKSIESIKLDSMGFKAVDFTSDNADYDNLSESFIEEDIQEDVNRVVIEKETGIEEVNDELKEDENEDDDDDNADYGDLSESFMEEDIQEDGNRVVIEKEIGIEEVNDELKEEDKEEEYDDGENKDFNGDNEPDADADAKVDDDENDGKDEKDEKDENDDDHVNEKVDNIAETKRIKKLQEADKDYTSPVDTDSSASTDTEEEEEDLSRRRSMRVRNVSVYITKRELRKTKRKRHDSDVTSEESSSNKSETDERDRKRMKAFMKNIKTLRPVIKVHPSKYAKFFK